MLYSVVHFPPKKITEAARRYQEPYAASFDVSIRPHFTIHPPFESKRSPEELAGILEQVCSKTQPFKARVNGFDSFFGTKFVLFMKLADESRMYHLQEKIDQAIIEADWDDVLEPGTKHRPHLTIGFFDKREELEEAEAKVAKETLDLEWKVNAVDLVAEVKPTIFKSIRKFKLGDRR